MSTEGRLLVRQVRSENGRPWQQRLVLKGLGLRGPGSQVTVLNERAIRGMIRKVLHLVEVSGASAAAAPATGSAAVGSAAVAPAVKPAKPAARAAKGTKS
jgi:large subunit ribosomal protein L30